MKKILKNIVYRLKKWNSYWVFIEEERVKAMIYCGRGFF
jgi:hypothetical protein